MRLEKLIEKFVDAEKINNEVVYNEFSLQHELGIFLREEFKNSFRVKFERNVGCFSEKEDPDYLKKFVKKEIDIVICKGRRENPEKYAIELKYPTNGAYPQSMFQCIKDIKFMEQVKDELGFINTYCLTLTSDSFKGKLFRSSNKNSEGIYSFFRNKKEIHGKIKNPQHNSGESYNITGEYSIDWRQIDDTTFWYYLLKI